MEFWMNREGVSHTLSRGSSGMQLNIKTCPACGDTRGRVYMNAETGLGNCFVCNMSFNKYKFIKEYLDVSFKDIMFNVKETLHDQGWQPKKTIMVATSNENIILPASYELPTKEGQNLLYLEKRNIDKEMAQYFRLRFSENGFWRYSKDKGHGLQNFENRIIIPVYDLDGVLKTFQGRDVTDSSDKKYLFPLGLPGTGKYLYNGFNALRSKRVIMGEGVFDVIAIKKALDEDLSLRDIVPVGSFGKHLSYGSTDGDDQLGRFIQLKAYGLQEVTIMWDGESAALKSAMEAAKLLNGIGLKIRIALLPFDKDPNEILPELVREAYYKASVYNNSISVKWMLNNPYEKDLKPKSFTL
jgi:DNA primase